MAMTRARIGQMDRLVTLRSVADGTDSSGFGTEVPTSQGTVWARRRFLSGTERYESDQVLGEVEVEYTIRYGPAVTAKWQVVDGSELWDVEAVLQSDRRERWTHLMCSRHDPNDTT